MQQVLIQSQVDPKDLISQRISSYKAKISKTDLYSLVALAMCQGFTMMHGIAIWQYADGTILSEKSGIWTGMNTLLIFFFSVAIVLEKKKNRSWLQKLAQNLYIAALGAFACGNLIYTVYGAIRVHNCGAVCLADRTNYVAMFVSQPGNLLAQLLLIGLLSMKFIWLCELDLNRMRLILLKNPTESVEYENLYNSVQHQTNSKFSAIHILEDSDEDVKQALKDKIKSDRISSYGSSSSVSTASTTVNKRM